MPSMLPEALSQRLQVSVRCLASRVGGCPCPRRRSLHSGRGVLGSVIGLCRRRDGAACDVRRDAGGVLNAAARLAPPQPLGCFLPEVVGDELGYAAALGEMTHTGPQRTSYECAL